MDRWVFSFITACLISLSWETLPATHLLPIICFLALFVLILPHGSLFSGFLTGLLWMASVGHWTVNWQLPLSHISDIRRVTGEVTEIVSDKGKASFSLKLISTNLSEQTYTTLFAPQIRLSWRQPLWKLKQGQRVSLPVKLKPVHGLANQGAFHYQQWLRANNFSATGYVKQKAFLPPVLEDETPGIRQKLFDQLTSMKLRHSGWIQALTLGERTGISRQKWALVQQTGVAHLLAISGLHLVSITTLILFIISPFIRFLIGPAGQFQDMNALLLVTFVVLALTFSYAWLAGLAIPVMRAWLMLCVVSLIVISRRHWRRTLQLQLCVFGFVLLFPVSLFGASFWLSFGAVFCIGFILWRWPETSTAKFWGLAQLLRLQVTLSLLMTPIVAVQFSQVPLLSPFINIIAVPYVTLFVVPLCLLGVIVLVLEGDWFASTVFRFVDVLLDWGIGFLSWCSEGQFHYHALPQVPLFVWLLALLGVLIVLMPFGRKPKLVAVGLWLPLFSYLIPASSPYWRLDVLDVGQGLSVLISKGGRSIVYDVGPAYPGGLNSADAVILPVLNAVGVKNLDWILVSHHDNDHAGSLPELLEQWPFSKVISNLDSCHLGWKLEWQGLRLESIWPLSMAERSSNHTSCVVRVSDGKNTVLLTGDIDESVEQQLVSRYEHKLKADLLIAPHHGSNTSSSLEFIETVVAKYVVFSAGFENRWGFPKQSVVNRYYLSDAQMYSTADSGQVTFYLSPELPRQTRVVTFRQDRHDYWYANE